MIELSMEQLESRLEEARDSDEILCVHFVDGDVWDLRGFVVNQDQDEESPHCSATVVRAVVVPEKKLKFFPPASAMMFNLKDVESVKVVVQ